MKYLKSNNISCEQIVKTYGYQMQDILVPMCIAWSECIVVGLVCNEHCSLPVISCNQQFYNIKDDMNLIRFYAIELNSLPEDVFIE